MKIFPLSPFSFRGWCYRISGDSRWKRLLGEKTDFSSISGAREVNFRSVKPERVLRRIGDQPRPAVVRVARDRGAESEGMRGMKPQLVRASGERIEVNERLSV